MSLGFLVVPVSPLIALLNDLKVFVHSYHFVHRLTMCTVCGWVALLEGGKKLLSKAA